VKNFQKEHRNTSWNRVGSWYQDLVRDQGHFFHKSLIIPGTLKLLGLNEKSVVLDLGCGQGVLARNLPKISYYLGVDIAPTLIEYAKKNTHTSNAEFMVGDVTKPLQLVRSDFNHAAIILALQNMENITVVFENLKKHLINNGKVILVINHPCFRIPRQSSWGIDENNKLEYRRINRYLTPLKIPINIHPGKSSSPLTWSFHWPLSYLSQLLFENGFVIEKIEEWSSGKVSQGKASRMENRARSEFPLFMAILAKKVN